jgi:hypothetical protein
VQLPVDITPIFAEHLARNRGPDPANPDRRQPPEYGIAAQLDGSVVDLRLTFLRGRAYCCYEAGCHLGLTGGKRWNGFRKALADCGIAAPARIELRVEVVVEDGAIFFDLFKPDPARRNCYEFAPVPGQSYRHTHVEGSDSDDPAVTADERSPDRILG